MKILQINDTFRYEVSFKNNEINLKNDNILLNLTENIAHNLDINHISIPGFENYDIKVHTFDIENKTATIIINGNFYEVHITDAIEEKLSKIANESNTNIKTQKLKASMPGLIIDIKVNEGDLVNENDALIILEAMKMENILTASNNLKIKKIHVKKGQTVEKGQVLIEFE